MELEEKRAVYTPQVQKLFAAESEIGVRLAGVLADRLNVLPEAETAVETLFGGFLEAVVVGSLDDAKRVSVWLKADDIGRTAMIILPRNAAGGTAWHGGDTIADHLGVSGEVADVLRNIFPREMSARLVRDLGVAVPPVYQSFLDLGRFRTAHLGDLTRNKEFEMMCPVTRLPPIDLFVGLHHGVETSNSPVIVHALRPRVAIINNGTRKGGDPTTMTTLASSPGLEDLWQIHFSQLSGQEFTQPGMFIANLLDEPSSSMPIAPITAPQPGPSAPPAPVHNGKAYWIKVSAKQDGSFTVTNQRNGFSKTYAVPGS